MGSYSPMPASADGAPLNKPKKLKILMLHGYTQSGSIFRSKTNALRKHLERAFSPKKTGSNHDPSQDGVELVYATAPLKLSGADVPGFESREISTNGVSSVSPSGQQEPPLDDNEVDLDAWGWWRKDHVTGEYINLEEGIDALAAILKTQGPFVGVIGFSQGAAAAAMLASLLEPGRRQAFERKKEDLKDAGVEVMEFPATFLVKNTTEPTNVPTGSDPEGKINETMQRQADNGDQKTTLIHPPLKFVVAYSGFIAPHPRYSAIYDPPITTPILHFIGSLDSVVEEKRSLALVNACRGLGGTGLASTGTRSNGDVATGADGFQLGTGCSEGTSKDGGQDGVQVVYHPGGHFVPSQRQFLNVLVEFIKNALTLSVPASVPAPVPTPASAAVPTATTSGDARK